MQRLKSRAEFQAVLAAGIVARSPHFALHRMPAPDTAIGVVIPKRWAKRAVTRNTIKRQIYSVSESLEFPAAAYVVRLRAGFAGFRSATSDDLKREVRGELFKLFARIAS